MPVLENGKYGTYNGRRIDKENEEIAYFDDTHEYIEKSTGRKGISVTTLIHEYAQPFDEDFWSSYKALESMLDMNIWLTLKKALLSKKKWDKRYLTKFNIDEIAFNEKKQEILATYAKNREASCERGTKIHAILENALYKKDKSISKYEFGGALDVYEGDYSTKLSDGVYPEYLVSYKDDDILITGQIDLLIIENKTIKVIDHKSNAKLEFKSFYNKDTKTNTMMKYPLNTIMDCNGMHYTLQLSLYAWMIQKLHPEYEVDRLSLHWIDHDNNESFIDVDYKKEEVEKMINHYKKQLKIKQQLDDDNFVL